MICVRCNKKTYSGVNKEEGLVCKNCDNMERYNNEEEGFFICLICGEADSPTNWMGGLPKGLCFSCSFWTDIIESYNRGDRLVIKGHAYFVGNESASRSRFRGFDGRKFSIEKNNGDIVNTTNLWHNGEIPTRFRDKLPDNAAFL